MQNPEKELNLSFLKPNIMHIAIAGNIGSGKTTLTKMLAAHYHWTPKFESVDYNPYLADFYEDMERWSCGRDFEVQGRDHPGQDHL